MRAVVITEPGGPEVLRVLEVTRPEPGPEEVLVRVAASGLNRADLLQRRGGYSAPAGSPDDIPGMEFSGTVEVLGPGASRWKVGDRVMGIVGGGAYAEWVACHEGSAMAVPEGVGPVDAAAIPEVFLTAFDAAILQAGLEGGDTLLVHAVGSGVGTAAVQIGRAWGAVVIGTSRTPEKLAAAAALGLTHAVHADEQWPDRILGLTQGRGADVILDLVGGPYLPGNQQVLALGGRHLVVGVPGGARSEMDLRALMARRGTIRGTLLRPRSASEKAELVAAFEERALPLLKSGALRPVVDTVYPAAEVAEAHRAMELNRNFGKLLLAW